MAAWDGDQTAMEAALARRSDRQAAALLARSHVVPAEQMSAAAYNHTMTVVNTDVSTVKEASTVTTKNVASTKTVATTETLSVSQTASPNSVFTSVHTAINDATAKSASDASDIDNVPLPPGIAAGEYQAVNQTGKTCRVMVPTSAAAGSSVREFHTVDAQNGDRWYLIRIATSK